ncbi:hypothetical protein ACI3KT_03035 [Microbacterium sp. ZW T6_19]|uniref:hypothetical protein n=1 Tax=Microbacterium sp. ZW T6_19 TaxID=3378082 RepID=UPI00385257E3
MRFTLPRLAIAMSGVLLLACAPFTTLVQTASAFEPSALSAVTGSPITEVSLEPYFPGEASWPSTAYPTWALRVELTEPAPVPGGTVHLDLSPNLTAAAAAGALHDDDGVELATYAVSPDGHGITITYSTAAASFVDLRATLGVFVSADSVGPGKTLVDAEATSSGVSFPLSASYSAIPWNSSGTVGTWSPSPSGSLRFLARSVVPAIPDFHADGGQWIGVGGVDTWNGTLEPVTGATRIFGVEELPSSLAGFTDQSAAWRPGVEYTLDEQESHDGGRVFGITVPDPPDGYIVVEQAYDLVSTGAAFFEASNPALPPPAREVFGAGTRIVTGPLSGHENGGDGVGGPSTLAFFASSGGAMSATRLIPALSASRTITPDLATDGEASGLVTVTVTNTGNAVLDVRAADVLSNSHADVELSHAAADAGSATTIPSGVEWKGAVLPGATVTFTYVYGATSTGPPPGSITWHGTVLGTVPRNAEITVEAEIADAEIAIAPRPMTTVTATPPGTVVRGALATTGADVPTAAIGTAGVLLFVGVGAVLLGARKRSKR